MNERELNDAGQRKGQRIFQTHTMFGMLIGWGGPGKLFGMVKEFENFLSNQSLHAAMRERGYRGKLFKSAGYYEYTRPINDEITQSLMFSSRNSCLGDVTLMISCRSIGPIKSAIASKLGDLNHESNANEYVLAVDLEWLRLYEGSDPNGSRLHYQLDVDNDRARFLRDLDSVGHAFVQSISEPIRLARYLVELDSQIEVFHSRAKVGGCPRSSDSYVYAAIIYAFANRPELSASALKAGEIEYSNMPPPREYWQEARLARFLETK